MRLIRIFVCAAVLCGGGPAARAAIDRPDFFGSPAVLPSGIIMLDGREVTLWGIDTLASDQQCWHENTAWDCGAQALLALEHYTANHLVHCLTKSDFGGGRVSAQCFRQKNGAEEDLAGYLVNGGWARDQQDVSGGFYGYDENDARHNRRGIWTSRFQSSEDWKSGTPRYVEYEEVALPASTVIENENITYTTILPAGSVEIIRVAPPPHPGNLGGTTTASPSTTTSVTGSAAIIRGKPRQPQMNPDQPQ